VTSQEPLYEALNVPVLHEVPSDARRILDVGCGSGSLGRRLKEMRQAEITGLTWSGPEAEEARRHLDRVVVADLETTDLSALRPPYDAILCSHVLEHIRDPAVVLRGLRPLLKPRGTLVVAIPNVMQWRQRLVFLKGHFKYSEGGLMDRTHLRFFDWETATELLRDSGWSISRARAVGHFPALWRLPVIGNWLDNAACAMRPNLFGDQFIIVARPTE
jgi:2-polyprenyl-3-methyl-5-hydroxy-6-metoxy-1,4-benzoquinol methylase